MKKVTKKIILVGNFGVGKTSLTRRFVTGTFSDEYITTIGVKIDKATVDLDGQEVGLVIWDIAGEASPGDVQQNYYLGTHGVIYVFNLARPATFENMEDHLEYIRQKLPNAPIVVMGNKKDLIAPEALEERLSRLPIKPDFTTSAKTGENVVEAFEKIARAIIG